MSELPAVAHPPHPTWPPKNRRHHRLSVLRIEIEDAEGIQVFDPNGVVLWDLMGGTTRLKPYNLIADMHGRLYGIGLTIDNRVVLYRSDDLEIRLTPDQLHRLISLNITPNEYDHLRELFGMFYEIHEDFYDPETGAALQPRED